MLTFSKTKRKPEGTRQAQKPSPTSNPANQPAHTLVKPLLCRDPGLISGQCENCAHGLSRDKLGLGQPGRRCYINRRAGEPISRARHQT